MISTIFGEHGVLPFDTPAKDKIKQEIDTNHDIKEEINVLRRPPGVLLSAKPNDHATNLKKAEAMAMIPSMYNPVLNNNYPPFAPHIDFRPKIDPLIHTLNNKPITNDKPMQEFPPIPDSLVAKQETISPKSMTPESPNEQRLLQKKRRVETSDGNPLSKRPETLGIGIASKCLIERRVNLYIGDLNGLSISRYVFILPA